VIVAAMIEPTASDIEWPELAQTCAANRVAMSLPRRGITSVRYAARAPA
jgi:hypothetical protein